MVLWRDRAHEDADLAVVDFTPVATPWAFDPDRMHTAFGKATRIEGEDAIGLAQTLGYLTHQDGHQGLVVPGERTDEALHDLSIHIDPGRDCLGILALQRG